MAGTRIITGQTTFSGAADRIIPDASIPGVVSESITVKAHTANAAACYVGPAGVAAGTGYELTGGQSVTLDYLEPADLFVIGTATQKISWVLTVTED